MLGLSLVTNLSGINVPYTLRAIGTQKSIIPEQRYMKSHLDGIHPLLFKAD